MSSVLETFYILFDSNSDKLKKGTEDANNSTKGLQASLGAADAAGIALGEHLVATFAQIGTAFLAAFSVERVAALVTGTADYNAQLAINSDRLGASVEDLDAWQKATERAGGSATGFIGTLDFLNKGLAGLHTPGGVSRLKPFLEELKINPKTVTSSLQLLGLLSDKAKELGAQGFAGIAERFGIDPGTQLLIAKGNAALQEQIKHEKELGVVTHAQAEEARKYKQAQDDLEKTFDRLATTIGGAVLPVLIRLFDDIGKGVTYLSQHKGLVEGFFIGVAGIITAVYLPAITEALVRTLLLVGPYLLVAAAILAFGVAIALVTDDVQNFLEGNRSVIGELSKKWPQLGEDVRATVKGMKDGWAGFVKALQDSKNLIVAIFDDINASSAKSASDLSKDQQKIISANNANWPKMAAWVKEANNAVNDLEKSLEKLASGVLGDIIKFFAKGVAAIPKALENSTQEFQADAAIKRGTLDPKAYEAYRKARIAAEFNGTPLPKPPPGLTATPDSAIQHAQTAITVADTSPLSALAGHTSNRGGDRNFKVNIENITIQPPPGANVEDWAKEINKHLTDQMHQAMDHFDDGVQG